MYRRTIVHLHLKGEGMKIRSLFVAVCLGTGVGVAFPQQATDVIAAAAGNISITPISHASMAITYHETVVLIDPARFGPGLPPPPDPSPEELAAANAAARDGPDGEPSPARLASAFAVRGDQMARFGRFKSATLILVTDIHDDHLDPRALGVLKTATTRLIVPPAAASRLLGVQGAQTMGNGEKKTIGDVVVESIPMYNVRPDPQFGAIFHPKGRGNGYVLTLGGKRLYVAGDTACTPEMEALKNIDVAFLPMNVPFTMPPTEAAECAKAFKPRIVYPYHYFEANLNEFEAALAGSGIEVRVRDWYSLPK